MYLIDTNIHIAYLLQDYENDEKTKQYLRFYETVLPSERLVADFVVNEFEIFMLRVVPSRYNLDQTQNLSLRTAVFGYLQEIFTSCTLICPTVETMGLALEVYLRNSQLHYISYTDSLLIALAKQNDYMILAKDGRLCERAKEEGVAFYKP